MQSLEIIVLLVFAVIAAGLIMAFLFSFDFEKFQTAITDLLMGKEETDGLQKVSFSTFLTHLYDCWQSCLAQNPLETTHFDCGAVYLETLPDGLSGNLNTTILRNQIHAVNYCEDCNAQVFPVTGISIPAAIDLNCVVGPQNLYIAIR